LLVRSREDAAVSFHHRDDREPHAGVAGRAFDDGAAGLEQAFPLGILDHPDRHPILDGISRVERLDLCEHRRLDETLGDPIDAYHRCVADGLEDVVENLARGDRAHAARDSGIEETKEKGKPAGDGSSTMSRS
jgi:hypothetical protein